jgi:hypothetical protein
MRERRGERTIFHSVFLKADKKCVKADEKRVKLRDLQVFFGPILSFFEQSSSSDLSNGDKNQAYQPTELFFTILG